jgi:hypothetical protein
VGPQARNIDFESSQQAARLSSLLLSIDMASARGGSCGGRCLALPHLTAKLSHVGVDADGLACHLHWPMDCDRQVRVQSLLMGVVPSHHIMWASAALDHFFRRGSEAHAMGHLMWY